MKQASLRRDYSFHGETPTRASWMVCYCKFPNGLYHHYLFGYNMKTILVLAALCGLVIGIYSPPKFRRVGTYFALGIFAISGFALGWIIWGPRDYMTWTDNPNYQHVFHPYMIALFGIPSFLISGGLVIGIALRYGIKKIKTCRTKLRFDDEAA
jgi:hypothetical protein